MTIEQFIRGKTKIITEFTQNRKELEDTVASRGFSFEPGFLYRIATDLEIETKLKLSDLNYQILQAVVERELKQSRLDYDLAYKNAVITWEAEKQALLIAWTEELAILKKEDAHQEELVKQYAIEVSKRAIDYIEAKEAIALELEEYQKQMAELDGQTAQYEINLANKKILTANKRLELLPYIAQLLEVEWDILDKEKILANKELVIAAMITQLANKEVTLADKIQELISSRANVISAEESLLTAKQNLLTALNTKVDAEEDLIDAEEAAQAVWTAQVYPATLTLLTTMNLYITELATQLALYEQIASVKSETVDVKEIGIDKQRLILQADFTLTSSLEALTSMLELLADHKESVLSPAISELVSVLNTYVNEGTLDQQITLKQEIATTQAAIYALMPQKVAKEILVAAAEESLNSKQVLLENARFAISNLISENKVESAENALCNIIEFANLLHVNRNDILEAREYAFAGNLNFKTLEAEERLDISTDNKLAIDTKQRSSQNAVDRAFKNYKEQEAEYRTAASGITARLNHLLRQD